MMWSGIGGSCDVDGEVCPKYEEDEELASDEVGEGVASIMFVVFSFFAVMYS